MSDSVMNHKPTDIDLRHAFVVLGASPFYIGPEVTGEVSGCHFLTAEGYVPTFWRRSRLRRFRYLVNDLYKLRTFWRWLRG